ncbi:hypothetical protein RD792_012848 [Penstemon davidsonii]|uniref:RRM domain-containing protein n=1 Tax=Penstemon davidsonii TaxID=160366 RepID=A0ABR0CY20_9LAMI|nr:hypothetical protein RD792_012848 [Penstemon davidsonii]
MANSQYGGQGRSTASGLPSLPPLTGKRTRSEFEMVPGVYDMPIYYDDRASHTVGAVYDLPIGSHQGDLARHQVNLPFDYYHHNGPSSYATTGVGGIRSEILLPPDASNTLFVEGFPAACTRREASRILFIHDIFRPFIGFRGLQLMTRESRQLGDGLLALCFVEFDTPAQAATAMDCLQDTEQFDFIQTNFELAIVLQLRSFAHDINLKTQFKTSTQSSQTRGRAMCAIVRAMCAVCAIVRAMCAIVRAMCTVCAIVHGSTLCALQRYSAHETEMLKGTLYGGYRSNCYSPRTALTNFIFRNMFVNDWYEAAPGIMVNLLVVYSHLLLYLYELCRESCKNLTSILTLVKFVSADIAVLFMAVGRSKTFPLSFF